MKHLFPVVAAGLLALGSAANAQAVFCVSFDEHREVIAGLEEEGESFVVGQLIDSTSASLVEIVVTPATREWAIFVSSAAQNQTCLVAFGDGYEIPLPQPPQGVPG